MPIREKPIKWDGKEEEGRYKNVDGFKYDVVKQTVVCEYEEMPEHFLADTPEEAERLFKKFSGILNGLSYTYSLSTGIDKSDLFGEALIGLGRASRDYEPERSDDFKGFAIVKIKSALNEYARKNATSIVVPGYILAAHKNIELLKQQLKIDYINDVKKLPSSNNIVVLLKRAAERSGITLKELIKRAEIIPSDVEFKDVFDPDSVSLFEDDQDRMFKALAVQRLLSMMDVVERQIAEGIMEGKSYAEIGAEFGKTDGWVVYKLNRFKERLKLKKEDL